MNPTIATVLDALDPEQRQVAEVLDRPMVVIAGAGTGKTRAITHRIAHASLIGAKDPRRTLAVTFTTRAAGEMRSRLDQLGVSGVQARTFHSAALRQLQHFWPRAHRRELPPVTANTFSLVAEAAGRHRLRTDTGLLRDLTGEISWAKVTNVAPGEYPRLARAAHRSVSGLDETTVARVLTSYEQVKSERDLIDFDDILLLTVALLGEHPEIADEVRGRYRHVLVDEFQDVSPLQRNVLAAWLGDSDDLCVVGDPHQSIHAFAGARPAYLTDFTRTHPDAAVVRLVRDYRSTPQVVGLANAVLRTGLDKAVPRTGLDGSVLRTGLDGAVLRTGDPLVSGVPTLVAQQPDGPPPEVVGSATEADEAHDVARWLRSRHSDGVPWDEMAVLFRIRAQSPAIEAALDDARIPYVVRGTERFYERAEIRQALGQVMAQAAQGPDQPGLSALSGILAGFGWRETAPEGAGSARERWESLTALLDLARDFDDEYDGVTLGVLAEELQKRADLQHAPTAKGVTLATIHSAKGLEWDAVAVTGVHEGSLPFVLATTDEQLAEEQRLLYVAVTRARFHLRVSWSRSSTQGRGSRNPSRFLGSLAPRVSAPERVREAGRKQRGTAQSEVCRVCGEGLRTGSDRKLGRHVDCANDVDEMLFEALRTWRKQVADETSMPAFVIFTDATLIALAERRPTDGDDLLKVPGVGRAKADKFGEQVLSIIAAATS
ncbi:ATP-dependent DNA helicase UvrD2 [Aestuariimicrobium kwangyangense]|uniref:ATP-dependent DNA helicase UvrD2 n=1 Tax=Aestuariimicrobium kwangyangense TaxID=396389 RepID=UPI000406700A|nr:ATP-dependent DNA helicase UvrD2 [Aestuariimicrobium kwangyangense]